MQQLKMIATGKRVLLVDDEPINREIAQILAEDGVAAVEMALARDYDLILMDMQMPKRDGVDACRLIRQQSSHRPTIVAMTANAFAEDRARCLEAGMDDFMSKPIDPERFFICLCDWLQR